MILRNMERRPLRTALSIGGVAAAVAIVDAWATSSATRSSSSSTRSSRLAMRNDVAVWTVEAVPDRARDELRACPA